MKRAGLQRIMEGDCYSVRGRSLVLQSDMATFLADSLGSELLERTNEAISGYPARQLHAASTGINSSLT